MVSHTTPMNRGCRVEFIQGSNMSLHKSLSGGSKLSGQRNVLTRAERLQRLTEEGRFVEGDPVYGLPKVRTIAVKAKKKKKKEKEEE